MKNARLLSTVAATLLLAVGAASAQDVKKDEGPARAPAAQQNAPAEKVAPAMKPGAKNARGQKAPETTGQAPAGDRTDASDKGAMDKKKDKGAAAKGSSDANGSGDAKAKTNENTAQGATGAKSSHSTTAEKDRATTGQGAASGSTKLSTEQRTKITNIIRQQKVAPAHLNVSIRVGNRVPASVRFYPLPAEVFVVYPEWRGYDYILVGNDILVINPRTHEIVAILEA
ncbi:MAG: DUF1236 domain-containing protein [Deltaproteobacteria bacterium]